MSKAHLLTLDEAVEKLTVLADLDTEAEAREYTAAPVLAKQPEIKEIPSNESQIREIFQVILHHFKEICKKEQGYLRDPHSLEGIKSIMLLVGEAAQKFDQHIQLVKQIKSKSIKETSEYRHLQEFYLNKIVHHIDDKKLGEWVLALATRNFKQAEEEHEQINSAEPSLKNTHHIFVDLETVKKDSEYELFFIRKEDGTRFFSPRLLRNIKLVCDLENYFGKEEESDLFELLPEERDQVYCRTAGYILKIMASRLVHFYQKLRRSKEHELVGLLNKAFMALMLASHRENLLICRPLKKCESYFKDFQFFLERILKTGMYQKWLAYPPKEDNLFVKELIEVIETLCYSLYKGADPLSNLAPLIRSWIEGSRLRISSEHSQAAVASGKLWNVLANDYKALSKALKSHPNGPLVRVLDILDEDALHLFHPLLQGNLPHHLFYLEQEGKETNALLIPAPISQEFIHQALLNEEFKSFLRFNRMHGEKHLLINLQDRTSWREHMRCVQIEELQFQDRIAPALTTITLAADTDFFHQTSHYERENHAGTFLRHFKEHVLSDQCGYYFPASVDRKKLSSFLDAALHTIHRVCFFEKNVLQRERRLEFIDCFYCLLQLKLISWIQPKSMSLTCKDGVDTSAAYGAALFAFSKFLKQEEWSSKDKDFLNACLHAPALFVRERIMLPERFHRLINFIRMLESIENAAHFEALHQLILSKEV